MTNKEALAINYEKTAFVLAGGGSLGAVQVGMLKALVQAGIRADMIVGASVGAINAAYFAGNPTFEGVQMLEQVWHRLKRSDIFPLAPLHGLLAFTGRRNSFIRPNGLMALIRREIKYRHLEEAQIPVHVVATDALDGREIVISKGPVEKALLASAAIPGIFPPVRLHNEILIDGGVTNNTPIPAAVKHGAGRIIVLPTGSPCAVPDIPKGALALMLHSLNLMIISQLIRDIDYYAGKAEIIVVPPICPVLTNISDFSKTGELIGRAMENTMHWLGHSHHAPGKVPNELHPHHH